MSEDEKTFPWTPGAWAVDAGSAWNRDNPPRAGHVVCAVETAFSSITVRAEPDHLACPSTDELNRVGAANADLICAAPRLARVLAGAYGYLDALPASQRPDEKWLAPIREALAAAGHPRFRRPL